MLNTSSNIKINVSIGLAFLIAIIGLLFPIDYNVYWDQCVYLLHSKYFAGNDIGYSELLFRSPLLPILSAPLWSLTSKIIYFKLISFSFSVAFIFFVFKYIKIISSKKIALVASVLMASFGILQLESKFFLTDIPALSFMFAALWITHTNKKYKFLIAGLLFGFTITMRLGYLYFSPVMAFYFIYNMKNKSFEIPQALIGFLSVYGIYNTWVYHEFGTVIGNISRARFEGHWVASYSFEKVFQIFKVTGISLILLSAANIYKNKIRSWLWPVLFILVVFVIIPYNPQNDRFIIPAIPFLLLLSVRFLNSIKNKKILILLLVIMLTEHSLLILKNRSQLATNSIEQPSIAKRLGLLIKEMPFDTVYTNSFYPSIAYYSDKNVIVPHVVGHDNNEFHYVDHAFLIKPGIVITNNLGPMNKKYFKLKEEHFKFIRTVDRFNIYEYLGNFSTTIKQYKLHILEAPGNLYGHGRGFLELDGDKVNKLYVKYNIGKDFLKDTGLASCVKGKSLSFKFLSNIQQGEISILSNNTKSIWLNFSPETINDCPFSGKSFKLKFELINNK